MRTSLAGLLLLSTTSALLGQGDQDLDLDSPKITRVREAIDAFMEQRWLPPAQLAGTTRPVMRRIAAAGLDVRAVERLLRSGRLNLEPTPPEEAVQPGRFTHRLYPLKCEHVDYETNYLLYVPRSYKADKPCSLVIVAHGGNGSMLLLRAGMAAYGGTRVWIQEAEKHRFILAAPITQRGWGNIGNAVVFSLISKLKRRYRIDPDRIYVTGHSMGGHMTWRSALSFADRWGAVAPMSGGYDFVKNGAIHNLFNVSGYATYCTREPYGIDRDNKINGVWLKDHGFDWVAVQGRGTHTILMGEMPKIGSFFADHPRDMYPKQVYARKAGSMYVEAAPDEAASIKRGWPRTEGYKGAHKWDRERPLSLGAFRSVRLAPLRPWKKKVKDPATGKEVEKAIVQTVWAENKGNNLIELTSQNARVVLIYLHPKMVDFSKPVRIVANGETVFEDEVEPDVFKMLNVVREFNDRGRIYHAEVVVKIGTDKEVPVPKRRS